MEKINHICKWELKVYSEEGEGMEIGAFSSVKARTIEFKIKGVCPICKREITKEELEWRANVGEREYARQATYVKRED